MADAIILFSDSDFSFLSFVNSYELITKIEQIELSIFNPSCRLIIIDFPNADLLTLRFYLGFLVYNNRLPVTL